MGAEPVGRSGHAMVSSGTRVLVLGGDFGIATHEDTDVIHVLDTKGFKYPDSTKNTTRSTNQSRAISL
ncbi:hypothetical protein Clacol_004073 [Clathrus columnatus]|uniref:Uncharacterized protein n=1 Tax=Clathrus columnatus TaxID=1419009 RepID=A0AAV5AAW1_9AGAM|nr:hypothetical protein Clacol_004073 [Clathrus columnatus]